MSDTPGDDEARQAITEWVRRLDRSCERSETGRQLLLAALDQGIWMREKQIAMTWGGEGEEAAGGTGEGFAGDEEGAEQNEAKAE